MKRILFFLLFSCSSFLVRAQCTASVSSAPATCFNACNGTATVMPSGGTPPYTYLWGPGGQTTQTVNGLCAGSYSVNSIDSVGCSSTLFFTITQPTQVTVSYTLQPATCSSCCDGSASASATGGTPPYTYSWFPSGNTNSTETGLCPGTYSFVVTDSSGCPVGNLFTIANSVGIQDPSAIGYLSVYPIPATHSVNILQTFSKPVLAEITLTNMLGQTVLSRSESPAIKLDINLDISTLPKGVYFVAVKTVAGTTIKRVIKQ